MVANDPVSVAGVVITAFPVESKFIERATRAAMRRSVPALVRAGSVRKAGEAVMEIARTFGVNRATIYRLAMASA